MKTCSSRLRLVAHLVRPSVPCGSLVEGRMILPEHVVSELDLADRAHRRAAARLGKTQPLSTAAVAPPPKRRRICEKAGPDHEQWQLMVKGYLRRSAGVQMLVRSLGRFWAA